MNTMPTSTARPGRRHSARVATRCRRDRPRTRCPRSFHPRRVVLARYYDPDIGRFTATDPLADLSQPGTLDSYGYVGGSPISAKDPAGLLCEGDNPCGQGTSTNNGNCIGSCQGQCASACQENRLNRTIIAINESLGGSGNCAPGSDGGPRVQQGGACGVVTYDPGGCGGGFNLCNAVLGLGTVSSGLACGMFLGPAAFSPEGAATCGGLSGAYNQAGQNAASGHPAEAGVLQAAADGFGAGYSSCLGCYGPLASTLGATSDDIAVIGRRWDTAVAKDWAGHEVLDLPKWSIAKNDAWVDSVVSRRMTVYLASPATKENVWDAVNSRPTVFGRELQQFVDAGYTPQGQTLVPPG